MQPFHEAIDSFMLEMCDELTKHELVDKLPKEQYESLLESFFSDLAKNASKSFTDFDRNKLIEILKKEAGCE